MGYFKLRVAYWILIMAGITGINKTFAQEIPEIEIFSEINGDFQQIKGVQQDELGNLWIASDSHIEKFNSYESEFFNNFKGLPKGTGEINTILIDSKDGIWIGTDTGLIKYDPVKDHFIQIAPDAVAPNIQQLKEDEKGVLWIGATTGIWKFEDEILSIVAKFTAPESVNELLSVGQEIVFGTSYGLFVLNKKTGTYRKVSFPRQLNIQSLEYSGEFYLIGTLDDGLYRTYPDFTSLEKIYTLPYSSNRIPISGISQDRSGNFYIATKGDGLYGLDKNLKFMEHYLAEGNSLSLADNHLVGLYLDKFNTLYVSTETGQINSLNLRENIFMFIKHDPKKYGSIADNFTTAIEKDRNGRVWFGTRQGLSIWNPANDSWVHIKNLSFSKQSSLPDVIKDLRSDDIHMWVATYNDGVYKVNIETMLRAHYSVDSKVKTQLQRVNALFVDSGKNVWVGGADGDLTQITAAGQIRTFDLRGINSIKELARGDIIAGGKNGVFRIRKGRNEISQISKLVPNAEELPYFTINAISDTSNEEIVLATEGAGILIYDPSKDSYWKMDRNSGLPSNRIRGLIIYENDEIWAGTSKGLINFRPEQEDPVVRIFDKDDGLLSNIFTRGSFARLDNRLAFGTFKGVSLFDPKNLKDLPDAAPNVIIGAVNINSKKKGSKLLGSADVRQGLDLDHHENSFHFSFYGMQPGQNNASLKYTWKLEGFDAGWSPPSSHNQVSYANLPPGEYTLLVRAGTLNGNWSPVAQTAINISSPWWVSTPAYLAYAAILILILGLPFFILRMNSKRRKKAARSSFYNTLNQELGTPLNILLTSLDNLSDEEENKNKHRLKNIVSRLRELLEPVLNFQPVVTKRNKNPKIDRIVVTEYMAGLKKDLSPLLKEKDLEIIINDQWNLEYFYYDVTYLNKIFFNVISNSVRYSFERGKIIINLIQTNRGDLKVQIADNGSGLPFEDQKIIKEYFRNPKGNTSKGNNENINLLYVKDFIDKLGGTIVFESSKDQGTTFTLILTNHQKNTRIEELQVGKPASVTVEKIDPVEQPLPPAMEIPEPELMEQQQFLPIEPEADIEIRILIAEDNDELRKVFHESLKKLGKIYEARNGMDAFEIATRIQPHIIIADLDMPAMDGLALSKALKNNSKLAEVPVYLMISDMEKLQLPHSSKNEILNIIKKPVNIDLLNEIIAAKLNKPVSQPLMNTSLSERNSNILKAGMEDFSSKLEKFIIRNIPNNSLTEEEIAAAMGVTPGTLHQKIRSQHGITLEDFILRSRLNFAKSLISQGVSDLGEVARQAGFSNRDIFYSTFKKQFGFMPGTIMEK